MGVDAEVVVVKMCCFVAAAAVDAVVAVAVAVALDHYSILVLRFVTPERGVNE